MGAGPTGHARHCAVRSIAPPGTERASSAARSTKVNAPGQVTALVTGTALDTIVSLFEAVAAAGADTFVAGSAIFGAKDYAATIAAMREEIRKAGRR